VSEIHVFLDYAFLIINLPLSSLPVTITRIVVPALNVASIVPVSVHSCEMWISPLWFLGSSMNNQYASTLEITPSTGTFMTTSSAMSLIILTAISILD
jgi:hypothetical protein